ncbi:MAG: hypothetical protein ACXVHV_11790, partial [Methanobacterium sp.]
MIICTKCKELNQLKSNFCSFCGYRLDKGLKQRLKGSKESTRIDTRLLIEIMDDTSNNRMSFGDFKSKI